MTFKSSQSSLVEAYSIVERRVRLSNKTLFYHKILIALADNIGLIIRRNLVQFKHILFFKN